MYQSSPNYIPKALPPNNIMVEIRALAYEPWGNINIQSLAPGVTSILPFVDNKPPAFC